MDIRWKASLSASCLHAAACFHEGLPIADASISAALEPAVEQLLIGLDGFGSDASILLPQLVALSSEIENNRQLVELAVIRVWGKDAVNESAVSQLTGCIAGLEAAVLRERPGLVDELAVRSRPLREQWEARGPGLLRQIQMLSDEAFLVSAAEVVLVAPIVGGHGRAHLSHNRILFEAVLANPHPQLPETLRLGWLLSQLNIDVPRYSDSISAERVSLVASLATLPLVLSAAETVELARLDAETLQAALQCWHLPEEFSERLQTWWDTYQQSTTRWPVALAALDAMLG